MTELTRRSLTGVALVTVILTAVWYGPYSFTALLLLIMVLSLQEFYRLLQVPDANSSPLAGMLLSASLMLSSLTIVSGLLSWKCLLLNLPIAFGVFLEVLYRPATKNPFECLALTFLGVIAIGIPMCFFVALPFLFRSLSNYYFEVPMGCFLLLWAHDSGAYLVGRKLGRHSLFSRISPKKTWEGSMGGVLIALTVAAVISRYALVLSLSGWLGLATIIVVTGTFGDLLKSMLKRSRGVKDSGTVLPGHGGMLDRFDSLIGSAPFIFAYLILLGNG